MSVSSKVTEPKFSITKAATIIGISRTQVRNLLNSGKLGYYQVDRGQNVLVPVWP
jgi:hypothetical protein